MPKRAVVDYKVRWKLKANTGEIWLKVEGGRAFSKVPLSSHHEFQALLTLLQGAKPVYYDTKGAYFATS